MQMDAYVHASPSTAAGCLLLLRPPYYMDMGEW